MSSVRRDEWEVIRGLPFDVCRMTQVAAFDNLTVVHDARHLHLVSLPAN